MQEWRNPIANALELRLSCTNPPIWSLQIGVRVVILVLSALGTRGEQLKFSPVDDIKDSVGWGGSWSDVYGAFREISKLEMIPPHEYNTTVDVRFILLTRDKPELLKICLKSLNKIHLDQSHAELHIWIDRSDAGILDLETVRIAKDFKWDRGLTFVHIHDTGVGVYNQWISSWRPRLNSKELAVFIEDHVTVSPYIYHWIKAIHDATGNRRDISGYCPSGAEIQIRADMDNASAYLYRGFSTTAFVPHPRRWREFQNWFLDELPKIRSGKIRPDIPEDKDNSIQYRIMEKEHDEINMWCQWYRYYCYAKGLWSVNPNIEMRTFAVSHLQKGWFSSVARTSYDDSDLVKEWDGAYVSRPVSPQRIDYDGKEYSGAD